MTAPYYPQHQAAARPYRPRRWWRANRIWVALIPLALALAILTSSFAFRTVHGDDLEPEEHVAVEGKLDFNTRVGDVPVLVSMQVTSQGVAQELNGYQAPPKAVVWSVEMNFAADLPSDVSVYGCRIFLADSDGRHYAAGKGLLGKGPATYQGSNCGASDSTSKNWTKKWTFGVPDSVRISSLQLWWDPPRVAVFPLSPP